MLRLANPMSLKKSALRSKSAAPRRMHLVCNRIKSAVLLVGAFNAYFLLQALLNSQRVAPSQRRWLWSCG
jgi:hypothetical protein